MKTSKSFLSRIVCLLLVISIITNFIGTPIYAQYNVHLNSNDILHKLEQLGYSDFEIIENYQADANRFKTTILLPSELSDRTGIKYVKPKKYESNNYKLYSNFPSNPKDGQKFTLYYDINFQQAFEDAQLFTASIATVSAVISKYSSGTVINAIASSIGLGVSVILLAESIYFRIKKSTYTGVRGSAQYIYSMTDDLYYDWILIKGTDKKQYY